MASQKSVYGWLSRVLGQSWFFCDMLGGWAFSKKIDVGAVYHLDSALENLGGIAVLKEPKKSTFTFQNKEVQKEPKLP